MALTGPRAYVNCSQYKIPIYTNSDMTEQIGTIYNSEMYTVSPIPDALASYPFMNATFRDKNGNKATGVMKTGKYPWSTEPEYVADQVLFHRRNSNGTSLVQATSTTISSSDSNKYMIFTVKAQIGLYEGTQFLRNLEVGTRIAMNDSTVGEAYPNRISIDYIEETVNGNLVWNKKTNHWVDLGFHIGSSPHNRALW